MALQRCPPDILSGAAEALAPYMNAAELSVSASHEKINERTWNPRNLFVTQHSKPGFKSV